MRQQQQRLIFELRFSRTLMLHPSSTLLIEKRKFTSTNQNYSGGCSGASRGIVSILIRICRLATLAGMLHHLALIDRLLHQLWASERARERPPTSAKNTERTVRLIQWMMLANWKALLTAATKKRHVLLFVVEQWGSSGESWFIPFIRYIYIYIKMCGAAS